MNVYVLLLPFGKAFPLAFLDFLLFFEKGAGLIGKTFVVSDLGTSLSLDSDFRGLDLEFLLALLNERSAFTGAFSDEISLNSGEAPFSIWLCWAASAIPFSKDIVAPEII